MWITSDYETLIQMFTMRPPNSLPFSQSTISVKAESNANGHKKQIAASGIHHTHS